MKVLHWNSLIRTPIRYWSGNSLEPTKVDKYRLEIRPCVEPDGKVHFAEHTLYRNDEIISIDVYQYNINETNEDLIGLIKAKIIQLN